MTHATATQNDTPEISVTSEPAIGMRSEVSTPRYSISVDDSRAVGGCSSLPSSLELLLAGLASSLEITCRRQADRLGVPLSYAAVKVSAIFAPGKATSADDAPTALACRIDVESGISSPVLDRLATLVRNNCAILGMLGDDTRIDIEFRPLAV